MPVPRRLPPLPPVQTWPKFFSPPRLLSSTKGKVGLDKEREYPGRVFIANQQLADSFVRALKLRKDEIVIEAFPGLGCLTRSVLAGGRAAEEAADEELRSEWWAVAGHAAPKDELKPAEIYPSWIKKIQPEDTKVVESAEGAEGAEKAESSASGKRKYVWKNRPKREEPAVTGSADNLALAQLQPTHKPRLVIALDANERVTSAGLGMEPRTPPSRYASWEALLASEDAESQEGYLEPLQQCPHEERLVAGPVDPFAWESVPYALSHPLVAKHLEKLDPTATTAERAWTDPEPPITYIASMPNSSVGELLSLQWLHSAIGAAQGKPSFLWKWGRARMAMLVSASQYDRLCAQAGEMARCRAGVLTQAMFDMTPLPPIHHVHNVDRLSLATEDRPLAKTQKYLASKGKPEFDLPRTVTRPIDFYPNRTPRGSKENEPHARPPILGILFTPKVNSLMKVEQRDDWDYCLRHLFVLSAQTLEHALPTLGFNGAVLGKDIESENDYAGVPVPLNTYIKDIEVEGWARIVDVFANWPFKPENLLIEKTFGLGDSFDPTTIGQAS